MEILQTRLLAILQLPLSLFLDHFRRWIFQNNECCHAVLYTMYGIGVLQWLAIFAEKYILPCFKRRYLCFLPFKCPELREGINNVYHLLPTKKELFCWLLGTVKYMRPVIYKLQETYGTGFEYVLCGSLIENLGIPINLQGSRSNDEQERSALLTDLDVMLVPKDITATEIVLHKETPHIILVTDEHVKDGYTKLRSFQSSDKLLNNICESIPDGHDCLSTVKARMLIHNVMKQMDVALFHDFQTFQFNCWSKWFSPCLYALDGRHVVATIAGPATKLLIKQDPFPLWERLVSCCRLPNICVLLDRKRKFDFEADFVFAIHCPVWPSCAKEWATRKRNWPPPSVVKSIIDLGCHVVPTSSCTSRDSRQEWRYSFSVQEMKLLSDHMSETVRKSFTALKTILKDHLQYVSNALKSYHLKTLLLWALEETDIVSYTDEKLTKCFHVLLQYLKASLEKRECCKYWVPSENLYEGFTERDFTDLLELLENIEQRPALYLSNFGKTLCNSTYSRLWQYFSNGLCVLLVIMFFVCVILGNTQHIYKEHKMMVPNKTTNNECNRSELGNITSVQEHRNKETWKPFKIYNKTQQADRKQNTETNYDLPVSKMTSINSSDTSKHGNTPHVQEHDSDAGIERDEGAWKHTSNNYNQTQQPDEENTETRNNDISEDQVNGMGGTIFMASHPNSRSYQEHSETDKKNGDTVSPENEDNSNVAVDSTAASQPKERKNLNIPESKPLFRVILLLVLIFCLARVYPPLIFVFFLIILVFILTLYL